MVRTGKKLRCLVLGLVLGGLLTALPATVSAQGVLYFLSLRKGIQTPSGDNAFNEWERNHGALQNGREVHTTGVEMDVFSVSESGFGLGLGLEVHNYEKTFNFEDKNGVLPPEQVYISGNGVLFSLKTYFRFGDFLPYLGAGLGNYYLRFREQQSGLNSSQSVDEVYAFKVGARYTLGKFGMLVEAGSISALTNITLRTGKTTLQAGGSYYLYGLSYLF